MQKDRLGDEDGLDSLITCLLGKTSKIFPQAFHGGEMNGVCCRRLLTNIEEIMIEMKDLTMDRLGEGNAATRKNNRRCTAAKLTQVVDDYANIFQVLDVIFSLLRIPAPKEEEIKDLKEAIFVLEILWAKMELSVTPKAHILFDHAVDQYVAFGGIADKVEDFVEKAHQHGKRLDALTTRMPAKCYRLQQLVHIKRLWIQRNPSISAQIDNVRTSSKRHFRHLNERKNTASKVKKRVRMEARIQTTLESFFVDLTCE